MISNVNERSLHEFPQFKFQQKWFTRIPNGTNNFQNHKRAKEPSSSETVNGNHTRMRTSTNRDEYTSKRDPSKERYYREENQTEGDEAEQRSIASTANSYTIATSRECVLVLRSARPSLNPPNSWGASKYMYIYIYNIY